MVEMSVIEARVTQLGVTISRWYKAELRELQHILMDEEKIVALVPGRYFAGSALIVATDHRVLLIDKRTFFLTLEDIRYDMIAEVDFATRMFDATLQIFTINKQHRFTASRYRKNLRSLTVYIQQQILQLRQNKTIQNTAFSVNPTLSRSTTTPLREVYPTRAVKLAHPHPQMRFAPPVRNFKKVGAAAIAGAHRFNIHSRLPHMTPISNTNSIYYQQLY